MSTSIKAVVAVLLVAGSLVGNVAQAQTVNPAGGKEACELLGGTWLGERCKLN